MARLASNDSHETLPDPFLDYEIRPVRGVTAQTTVRMQRVIFLQLENRGSRSLAAKKRVTFYFVLTIFRYSIAAKKL